MHAVKYIKSKQCQIMSCKNSRLFYCSFMRNQISEVLIWLQVKCFYTWRHFEPIWTSYSFQYVSFVQLNLFEWAFYAKQNLIIDQYSIIFFSFFIFAIVYTKRAQSLRILSHFTALLQLAFVHMWRQEVSEKVCCYINALKQFKHTLSNTHS